VVLDGRNAVAIAATLGVGILAGILVGTGLAAYTAKSLQEASWVMRFQLEDRLFAKVMPPLMLTTLVALIAACALARGHSRSLFAASVLFMVLVLVVTIGFEVPLNKQIQSWTPGDAPSSWQQIRDRWLERHLLRTISSVLGFLSALLALAV
jgi:uncharacterized membrane protein